MLKEVGIEGIYIVHALQGYEVHEERMNEIFGKMNLDYEFVTDGDVSHFTPALLEKYFCPEIDTKLSKGIISCTLNHILSYEKMVANNNKYALVFENDPFFLGDFLKKITRVAKEADTLPPGFIISLENTTLRFPYFRKVKKGKYLYDAEYGRAAGAYLIDLKAAKDILAHLKTHKCCQVIDWWHNTLIKEKVVKMYWAHPAFVEQGSHNGLMSSTISSKNKSYGRRLRWNAQKFYKMYIYRWFK
ncbi:MAG: glycosyltransferase family 25 protein [Ginsengibacter sp.]